TARRRGPGRPKLPRGSAKKQIFAIRLAPQEKALLEGAAKHSESTSASDWAREVLVAAAEAVMTSRRRSRAQKEGRRLRSQLNAVRDARSEGTPTPGAIPR